MELPIILVIVYLIIFGESHTIIHVYYKIPGQQYRKTLRWTKYEEKRGFYPPSGKPYWKPVFSYSTLTYAPHKDYWTYCKQQQKQLSMTKNTDYQLNANEVTSQNPFKNELFFEDYPHLKSLQRNQLQRMNDKLSPYKLGSLRWNSPYFRP